MTPEEQKEMYRQHHGELCQKKHDLLIGPLRETARKNGYALAVHGSLRRDIDLIAVPWIDKCSTPKELAAAIREKAQEVSGYAWPKHDEDTIYFREGTPGSKPHGRLCWTFHLGGGPYIDLAVMPMTDPAYPDPSIYFEDEAVVTGDGLPNSKSAAEEEP